MFCTKCGHQLSDSAKFCSKCGYDLKPLKEKHCDVFYIGRAGNTKIIKRYFFAFIFIIIAILAIVFFGEKRNSFNHHGYVISAEKKTLKKETGANILSKVNSESDQINLLPREFRFKLAYQASEYDSFRENFWSGVKEDNIECKVWLGMTIQDLENELLKKSSFELESKDRTSDYLGIYYKVFSNRILEVDPELPHRASAADLRFDFKNNKLHEITIYYSYPDDLRNFFHGGRLYDRWKTVRKLNDEDLKAFFNSLNNFRNKSPDMKAKLIKKGKDQFGDYISYQSYYIEDRETKFEFKTDNDFITELEISDKKTARKIEIEGEEERKSAIIREIVSILPELKNKKNLAISLDETHQLEGTSGGKDWSITTFDIKNLKFKLAYQASWVGSSFEKRWFTDVTIKLYSIDRQGKEELIASAWDKFDIKHGKLQLNYKGWGYNIIVLRDYYEVHQDETTPTYKPDCYTKYEIRLIGLIYDD